MTIESSPQQSTDPETERVRKIRELSKLVGSVGLIKTELRQEMTKKEELQVRWLTEAVGEELHLKGRYWRYYFPGGEPGVYGEPKTVADRMRNELPPGRYRVRAAPDNNSGTMLVELLALETVRKPDPEDATDAEQGIGPNAVAFTVYADSLRMAGEDEMSDPRKRPYPTPPPRLPDLITY